MKTVIYVCVDCGSDSIVDSRYGTDDGWCDDCDSFMDRTPKVKEIEMAVEIIQPRQCPNCEREITILRIERRVGQCFEMSEDCPEYNDYQPAEFDEGEWEAICYETREGEGCMRKLPIYAEDSAQYFWDGEIDGNGNELMDVKVIA